MLAAADVLATDQVDVSADDSVATLVARLALQGFVRFDGVTTELALLRLTSALGTIVHHPDSDISGITTLTRRAGAVVRSGRIGFSDRELSPHTDRSSQHDPPGLVVMACARPAEHGGESAVVDGLAVYADLAAHVPEALEALSAPRCALFGGAAGFLGAVFERQPDGRVAIRLRMDDLARFSPLAQQGLPALRRAIERHTVTFRLSAGEGYVVANRWWLHARSAFTGHRVMWRITADPHRRWDIPSGFALTGIVQ